MQYIYFVQYEAQTGEIKINNKVSINTQTGEIIINNKVSSNNSLNQIIQGWNQRTSLNIGLSKKSFPFIFVRHEKEDWAQHVNKTNKRLYLFAQENHKSSSNRNLPIIHFTDINIFDESSSNAKDAYRYKKVVDSSIWNFYIWKEKGKTIDMLKDAIDKIGK